MQYIYLLQPGLRGELKAIVPIIKFFFNVMCKLNSRKILQNLSIPFAVHAVLLVHLNSTICFCRLFCSKILHLNTYFLWSSYFSRKLCRLVGWKDEEIKKSLLLCFVYFCLKQQMDNMENMFMPDKLKCKYMYISFKQ